MTEPGHPSGGSPMLHPPSPRGSGRADLAQGEERGMARVEDRGPLVLHGWWSLGSRLRLWGEGAARLGRRTAPPPAPHGRGRLASRRTGSPGREAPPSVWSRGGSGTPSESGGALSPQAEPGTERPPAVQDQRSAIFYSGHPSLLALGQVGPARSSRGRRMKHR